MGVRAKNTGRRVFVLLIAMMAAVGLAVAPPASADLMPIGNLGDTLRVEFKGIVADVTVHDVLPTPPPPGFGPPGPRAGATRSYRANVTVHVVKAPNPFVTSLLLRVQRRHALPGRLRAAATPTPPTPCSTALQNAPPGSTVTGGVYWHVYRDLVTNVVLLDKQTGSAPGPVEHLAAGHAATLTA